MMQGGALDPMALPLTSALLDALTNDSPLVIPWAAFHRMA
jgi:hypothetical protein